MSHLLYFVKYIITVSFDSRRLQPPPDPAHHSLAEQLSDRCLPRDSDPNPQRVIESVTIDFDLQHKFNDINRLVRTE